MPELGITVLHTGENTNRVFELLREGRGGLQAVPETLNDSPDGFVKAPVYQARHELKGDMSLVPFFLNPEVVRLLGSLKSDVNRIKRCQLADGEYCHHELTTSEVAGSYVRLCWHHDNQDYTDKVQQVAFRNLVAHRVSRISAQLGLSPHRPLSYAELCWWAVRHDVYQHLPSTVLDKQFDVEETSKRIGFKGSRDTNARYTNIDTRAEMDRLAKPVLKLLVDDEPALMFMRRPKPLHWESEKYLAFVRSLPCVVTGRTEGVVAHHLIGHGEGKMAGKAHDLFTMPLTAGEHRKFHDDPKGWEARNGSQLLHIKNIIKKALDLGAIE